MRQQQRAYIPLSSFLVPQFMLFLFLLEMTKPTFKRLIIITLPSRSLLHRYSKSEEEPYPEPEVPEICQKQPKPLVLPGQIKHFQPYLLLKAILNTNLGKRNFFAFSILILHSQQNRKRKEATKQHSSRRIHFHFPSLMISSKPGPLHRQLSAVASLVEALTSWQGEN